MSVSLQVFRAKKQRGERIAMVSLYDAPSAVLCCDANVDCLLVGDSMGNVILGYENTIPVTLEAMAHHAAAVARGVKSSTRPEVPVIADMPFGSWHGERDSTARHGAALMQAGAQGVKVEGASPHTLEAVRMLTQMGAPVMGHLGFTPQSTLIFESVVQGKTAAAAAQLLESAVRLQEAGCFAVVLEVVPVEVAAEITQQLQIPTIGIGAGPGCDGQVLVWHDLTGQTPGAPWRFVKRYAEGHRVLSQAATGFVSQVHAGAFPTEEHGWPMSPAELAAWRDAAGCDGTP
ncbi:MAG TPA: 3-methyl-2-oxobutanoate hydroxymethyltransferase [Abditibacteriaceae bacterium]|nr:3-methyl-2-oxobutanoate hydroxymethyltransferase [Abditibacteriaceae bacterium]